MTEEPLIFIKAYSPICFKKEFHTTQYVHADAASYPLFEYNSSSE